MTAGIERARQAKAERARSRYPRTHRCPACQAEVITYQDAWIYHRCRKGEGKSVVRLFDLVPTVEEA